MFGPRKIDSLAALAPLAIASDAVHGEIKRRAAERIAESDAQIVCVHGIDAGDAYALATQFACGWAYRGGEALLWRGAFHAHEVHDRYLPAPPARPFERRGLLEVLGAWHDAPLALVAARFADDRSSIREWRFARTALRRTCERAIFFADGLTERTLRVGVADLGFATREAGPCAIYVRDVLPR